MAPRESTLVLAPGQQAAVPILVARVPEGAQLRDVGDTPTAHDLINGVLEGRPDTRLPGTTLATCFVRGARRRAWPGAVRCHHGVAVGRGSWTLVAHATVAHSPRTKLGMAAISGFALTADARYDEDTGRLAPDAAFRTVDRIDVQDAHVSVHVVDRLPAALPQSDDAPEPGRIVIDDVRP
ncbi:hypothetical protein AB0L40_10930 [Patulibacter sp. NPDC049589]|uniref:hypothetical protein n=1 Tax=Patulibacter sp. NPDC049589 TaxID=3154731 RepID=UPI0034146628